MSWQLASLAVLAFALGLGFAWYERARPDARVVALVGTLAAFAALGRVAFAAVPNVKPTTDIVLVAGFALGGGPGFAVGALAGLSSNFFFGQGPWTPWQMAAWGAVGVLGAALAWAVSRGGRRSPAAIGRWPLAIVCCIAGFAFTAVQDVGDWVTYSDHSRAALALYVGQGLGFDAIHATGCLLFALALGPALIRTVQRFSLRLEVRWVAPLLAVAVLSVPAGSPSRALAAGSGAAARAADSAPAARAAAYLLGAQNSDGGFGAAPGQPSAQLYAGWAALGLASAGERLSGVARGGTSVISYIRSGLGRSPDTGTLERTILVARAAGTSARSFAGRDLVAALERRVARDGSVADQVNLTAFGILALRAAGVAPRARTWAWLERQQNSDGGFGFAGAGGASDSDDTGAVLEALGARSGRAAAAVRRRAVAFLRDVQNHDGGFPSQTGSGSNAQSTAWAVQGLYAAGVDPSTLHRGSSPSPIAFLDSLVSPGGRALYQRGLNQTPVWVTGEVLMALERAPLPIAPPAPVSRPHVSRPAARSSSGRQSPTSHRSPSPARRSSSARGSGRAQGSAAAARPRSAAAGSPGGTAGSTSGTAAGSGSVRVVSVESLIGAIGLLTAIVLEPAGLG